jgi:tetratricopeptide (TPR) repeat protein
VCDEYLRGHPDHPRRVQLRVQRGLVRLARGELARQESEVSSAAGIVQTARDHLRAAVDELKTALDEIGVETRREAAGNRRDDWKRDELLSLARHVEFQLARAYRNQGQTYPAQSPDRTNSVMQARELVARMAQSETSLPLAWESRLEEIACLRLLEDYAAARRRLELFDSQAPPPAAALAGLAERIRVALADDDLETALALVEAVQDEPGANAPELELAMLEACLAAWRRAENSSDAEAASAWQARSAAIVRKVDEQFGAYWRRRAETLLAAVVGGSPTTGDPAILMRAAESFFRSGQVDDAIAAYDRAHTQALAGGDHEAAFAAAYAAAHVEQDRGRFVEAAGRFRALALALPDQPASGDAHLLAIYSLSQVDPSSDQSAWDEFLPLIEEHLDHWPAAPSANQARLWLGRIQEGRRHWEQAVAAYSAIEADHAAFHEAVTAAGRAYRAWLESCRAAGQPVDDTARRAAEHFETIILGEVGELPELWSDAQKTAALAAAEIWVEYFPDQFDRAVRILDGAAASASPDEAWQAAAASLRVAALAGAGRVDEAVAALERAGSQSAAQLLALVLRLARFAAGTNASMARAVAELELVAIERLEGRRDELTAEELLQLELARGHALAAAGRREEALAALTQLAETAPQSGRVQEAMAIMLEQGGDTASREAALAKWTEIARRSPSGGERWFRAIYHQASLLLALARPDEAARLVRVAENLHEDLGGDAWKPLFMKLLEEATAAEREGPD